MYLIIWVCKTEDMKLYLVSNPGFAFRILSYSFGETWFFYIHDEFATSMIEIHKIGQLSVGTLHLLWPNEKMDSITFSN